MSKNMAILKNGIVVNVIVTNDNEPETTNQITYTDQNPAYIDGDYVDGYFYNIQPYPSWTRHEGNWICPVAKPNNGKPYLWVEAEQTWTEIEITEVADTLGYILDDQDRIIG